MSASGLRLFARCGRVRRKRRHAATHGLRTAFSAAVPAGGRLNPVDLAEAQRGELPANAASACRSGAASGLRDGRGISDGICA